MKNGFEKIDERTNKLEVYFFILCNFILFLKLYSNIDFRNKNVKN